MRNALREPLVHFLGLGLLLFAFFAWRGGGSGAGRIVVSAGQIEHLAAGFTRSWQRAPTDEELKALVDDYVREELATREAIASGLDRDDAVVRRRLRQKLEFLVEDAVDQAPPTDAELEAWLEAHPDAFRAEPQVALRQVFVSREERGKRARKVAEQLLTRLRAAGPELDAARLCDRTMLPAELPLGPVREVALTFGGDFARALETVPPGEWSGPIESSYGFHLVLVRERLPGSGRDLASIRPQVEREVVAGRRKKALDALYQALVSRYSVTIERPPATDAPSAPGRRAER